LAATVLLIHEPVLMLFCALCYRFAPLLSLFCSGR
jgi:hypothetical protein